MTPRPGRTRGPLRRRRALSAVLSAVFLLCAAPPAGAAPLDVTTSLGPQGSALDAAIIVHDDFETVRVLDLRPAAAPVGATWTPTGGATWSASGGAGGSQGPVGSLTVAGTVPGVDITAVLAPPGRVTGLLSAGTVRYGVAALAGTNGRIVGGVVCTPLLSALGVFLGFDCSIAIWSVVGGTASPVCSAVGFPNTPATSPRLRLQTDGTTATLSYVGSTSTCSGPVPVALRDQTGVGMAVDSSVVLSVLGSIGLVQQMTAVRADRLA